MANLLCVGIDDAAMMTRKLTLEKAGHTVTQTRDLLQVKAACEGADFSIAILCQSLNSNEKKRIRDVLLTNCKAARILELHKSITPELSDADWHLQIGAAEPQGLTEAVNTLLRMPRKKKARPASKAAD